MRIKLSILSLLLVITSSLSAQSFFKALPKQQPVGQGHFGGSGVFGTTQWNFRPIVSVASYSFPGNEVSTGGGIAYELNTLDPTTQTWSSVLSISGLLYYNLPLATETRSAAPIGAGIMLGFINNHILVGAKYDGKRMNLEIGTGINFNN